MGSELFDRVMTWSDEQGDTLMREVWAGTPWMVNVYTGSGDERHGRRQELVNWLYDTHGPPSHPFGHTPRPGEWREGNASVFGWSWFGFRTEEQMRAFEQKWPSPEEPRP